jgi:light-regulated signal transduction histidine kinase (bacteriophytochrome)
MSKDKNNDREQLAATCAELEEQVKLLVKTELKLRRTQAELVESKKTIEEYNRNLEEKVRKRTEELLRRNEELSDFAHMASHDLKEPLRKVSVNAERLREEFHHCLKKAGDKYLERILSATTRMHSLINDLLRYADVTVHSDPFTMVDLSRTAADVMSDLEVSVEKSRGHVSITPLPVIEADPLQMRQLFQNLIGNALKFHQPDRPPVVTVREVKPSNSGLCGVAFEDNGIGIDSSHRDRAFGIFQRLNNRNDYEGSGIGLAICKKIVERHHGSIHIDSTPGQGTVFTVYLPYRQK